MSRLPATGGAGCLVRGGNAFGAIAQLGERYNGIVEVAGSIPAGSTKPLKLRKTRSASRSGFFRVQYPGAEARKA